MPCLFFFAQLHKPKFRPDLDSLKHSNMFFCAIDFIDLKILCFDFTSFYIRPLLTMINEAKIKRGELVPVYIVPSFVFSAER